MLRPQRVGHEATERLVEQRRPDPVAGDQRPKRVLELRARVTAADVERGEDAA
jgi:hypothetical protein